VYFDYFDYFDILPYSYKQPGVQPYSQACKTERSWFQAAVTMAQQQQLQDMPEL
jgi:hypothetical protein